MRDLKYLFAYTVPVSVYISFISTGIWTYSAVVYVFLVIPLLDLILGEEKDNIPDESVAREAVSNVKLITSRRRSALAVASSEYSRSFPSSLKSLIKLRALTKTVIGDDAAIAASHQITAIVQSGT